LDAFGIDISTRQYQYGIRALMGDHPSSVHEYWVMFHSDHNENRYLWIFIFAGCQFVSISPSDEFVLLLSGTPSRLADVMRATSNDACEGNNVTQKRNRPPCVDPNIRPRPLISVGCAIRASDWTTKYLHYGCTFFRRVLTNLTGLESSARSRYNTTSYFRL
jgi:hypothetical protein